jgi:hypothetical protein
MQVQLILPQLVDARATLWCPQVGGPVDPNSEAHDVVLNLFGRLSKTERPSRRRSVLRKNSRRPPVDSKAADPLTGTGASVHRSAHPNPEEGALGYRAATARSGGRRHRPYSRYQLKLAKRTGLKNDRRHRREPTGRPFPVRPERLGRMSSLRPRHARSPCHMRGGPGPPGVQDLAVRAASPPPGAGGRGPRASLQTAAVLAPVSEGRVRARDSGAQEITGRTRPRRRGAHCPVQPAGPAPGPGPGRGALGVPSARCQPGLGSWRRRRRRRRRRHVGPVTRSARHGGRRPGVGGRCLSSYGRDKSKKKSQTEYSSSACISSTAALGWLRVIRARASRLGFRAWRGDYVVCHTGPNDSRHRLRRPAEYPLQPPDAATYTPGPPCVAGSAEFGPALCVGAPFVARAICPFRVRSADRWT